MPFTRMVWILLLVVSLVATTISYAKGEHSASFVVKETVYGKIRGYTQEVFPRRPVDIFLGVPYASPPVGKLRFEPPQALPHWDGIINTTELSPACAQSDSALEYLQAHYPDFDYQSEDCLYLNIFAPQLRKDFASLPVFVFVHGGSNDAGMGGMFDGSIIASFTDIILITFNYRLGSIGFLSTRDDVLPGNYGLFDQLAALRWVRDNIHFFGAIQNG
ncbi:neuroligin-4, X-linked-like [Liolophura sinensis]|uniref:neuroligin-4, X-linked-like n=1 Tax=Liolophura sinensis TaxID=3198878 RepID=UPI0031592A8F